MQGAKGSGDAWPGCVDKFLDLQWRQKAPRESLILSESAGKLLAQINELFTPSLWKEEGFEKCNKGEDPKGSMPYASC